MSEAEKTPDAANPVQPPAPQEPASKTEPAAPARAPGDRRGDRGAGGRDSGGKRPYRPQKPRTMNEPVRSLEPEQRPTGVNLRDIDAEIEGELAAALTGIGNQDQLLAIDNSKAAQQKAAAAQDHGKKQGKVITVHGQDVFIEVPGGRSQGVMPVEQFPDGPPAPGTIVEVSIEGYDHANGCLILSRRGVAVVAAWSTVAEGMTVEARVLESNKGGLAVDVNGIRGFMPISQIDLYRVEQPEQYVNQRLLCMVTEVVPEERNLVVSRRALLEKEREENREKLWAELNENQVRTGIVRSVRDFGAFVDLGGVDGLLHVSEMSWQRVTDPTKIVQPGQAIKVVVLKIDRETRKVGLGLKQLEASPWDTLQDRYSPGQVIKGPVTRTMDFGAFVQIEPGVEGLVHISELAPRRVWRVIDVVKEGQEVEAKILSIDKENRRISLSLKAAIPVEKPKTAEEAEEEVEETPTKPPRPRNYQLRGGIGVSHFEMPTEKPDEDEGEA